MAGGRHILLFRYSLSPSPLPHLCALLHSYRSHRCVFLKMKMPFRCILCAVPGCGHVHGKSRSVFKAPSFGLTVRSGWATCRGASRTIAQAPTVHCQSENEHLNDEVTFILQNGADTSPSGAVTLGFWLTTWGTGREQALYVTVTMFFPPLIASYYRRKTLSTLWQAPMSGSPLVFFHG